MNEVKVTLIDIERIVPNKDQPRKTFDDEKIKDLSLSILKYGILQPILVTPKESNINSLNKDDVVYEIIAGERRYRASKKAGLKKIPSIIRDVQDTGKEKLEIAIIENLQREQLNAVDKANSFQRLAEDFKLTHEEIASKMSKSREYISNSIRILSLPEEMLSSLKNNEISEGHARTLLSLKENPEKQKNLFREIIESSLSVRDAEKITRGFNNKSREGNSNDYFDIENKISNQLGSVVSIEKNKKGMKMTINLDSEDDLNKILKLMTKEKSKDIIHETKEKENSESEYLYPQDIMEEKNMKDEEKHQNNNIKEIEDEIDNIPEEKTDSFTGYSLSSNTEFVKETKEEENSKEEYAGNFNTREDHQDLALNKTDAKIFEEENNLNQTKSHISAELEINVYCDEEDIFVGDSFLEK